MSESIFFSTRPPVEEFYDRLDKATGMNWRMSGKIPALDDEIVNAIARGMGAKKAEDTFYVDGSGKYKHVNVMFPDGCDWVMCTTRIYFSFTTGITDSNAGYYTIALVETGLSATVLRSLRKPAILAFSSVSPLLDYDGTGDPPLYGEFDIIPCDRGDWYNMQLKYSADVLILFNRKLPTRPMILAMDGPYEEGVPKEIKVYVYNSNNINYLTKVPLSLSTGTHYTEYSSFEKSPRYLFAVSGAKPVEAGPEDQSSDGHEGLVDIEGSVGTLWIMPGGVLFPATGRSGAKWCYSPPMNNDGTPRPLTWLSVTSAVQLVQKLENLAVDNGVPPSDMYICVKRIVR